MPDFRELRKQARLSQAELAIRSGIRQATISALENGRSSAHASTVLALATGLDLAAEVVRGALNQSLSPLEASPVECIGHEWAFLEGLDADLRSGLAQSLVAEWTHSSTALEGNTITAGDTLFVLSEGLTISGKSLREHQELHGHAQALGLMTALAQARQTIRVEHLHQLHRAIMTGAVIDSLAPVGRWKVEPNGTNAITTGGTSQWHDYAQPKHVPFLIEAWIKLLAQICRSRSLRTASGAGTSTSTGTGQLQDRLLDAYTDLHLGLTAIHPYADGNGRLARLLANLPILRAGQAPLLIALAKRRDYLTLLGDYTLARGRLQPAEDLVKPCPERDRLRTFFADQWRSTQALVADFQNRQASR